MKYILTLLTTALFSSAFSQFYVAARSGLNVREYGDPTARVLATIPYGTAVTDMSDDYYGSYTSEGIHGSWRKITYNGQTGYVFTGFLLPYPAPTESTLDDYISRIVRIKAGPLEYSPDPTQDMVNSHTHTIYTDGVYKHEYIGYEYHSTTIGIPNISMEQAFILCRLLPDFRKFIGEKDAYPLRPVNTEEKIIRHVKTGYDTYEYLESIRIEIFPNAMEFLEIRSGEGRVEIITGSGV